MKTKPALIILTLWIATATVAFPEDSLKQLLEERRTVLETIVKHVEAEIHAGTASPEAFADAKLQLARFQLEIAPTVEERRKIQQDIVTLEKERYQSIEGLHQTGRATIGALLSAKDRLLKERIRLLEMK